MRHAFGKGGLGRLDVLAGRGSAGSGSGVTCGSLPEFGGQSQGSGPGEGAGRVIGLRLDSEAPAMSVCNFCFGLQTHAGQTWLAVLRHAVARLGLRKGLSRMPGSSYTRSWKWLLQLCAAAGNANLLLKFRPLSQCDASRVKLRLQLLGLLQP